MVVELAGIGAQQRRPAGVELAAQPLPAGAGVIGRDPFGLQAEMTAGSSSIDSARPSMSIGGTAAAAILTLRSSAPDRPKIAPSDSGSGE